MKLIAPEIAARRARAAVELAPYERAEVEQRAAEKGLRPAAFARIVAKRNPRGFKTIEELWAFADACEVPHWFLEDGLESEVEIRGIVDRGDGQPFEEIRVRLAAIEGELGLRDVSRASNQALTGALDRAGAAGHPAVPGTRDASDATRGPDAAPARGTSSSARRPGR